MFIQDFISWFRKRNETSQWLKINSEEQLQVVCESGDVFTVFPEDWVYDAEAGRIFFEPWQDDDIPSAKTLFTTDAIDKLIVPTQTKTARNNIVKKTEMHGRKPISIERYSYVSNVSSNPCRKHSFSPPTIEVWSDEL